MSKYFYDKKVDFYSVENSVDSEGGRTNSGQGKAVTINCNPQYRTSKEISKTYGTDYDADLVITCTNDEPIKIGSYCNYMDKKFRVIEILLRDSHMVILCQS